jgi:F-type H+-transporting ATPase subunit alpha
MKQKQYSTMSVAEMAVSLFAANEGYLDDVEAKSVVEFEQALQSHMKSQHADFMDEMNRDQAYSDEVAAKLHEALKDFKANGSW